MSFSDVMGLLTLIVATATLIATVAAFFYTIGKDIRQKKMTV
jgi:hypothetical protein